MNDAKIGYKKVKGMFNKYILIPEDWRISSLTHKDILNLSSGESINNIQLEGNYPVYGSNGIIGYTENYNESDAILIGRVGSSGAIHYLDDKAWITDNVLIAKINKHLNKKFCYYILCHLKLERFATKSAQPLLTQTILKSIKIILPILDEQQKIASILSNVDALIESTQKIIERTERLKKGLMQQLLTRGIGHKKFKKIILNPRFIEIIMPKDWTVKPIFKILKITMGQSPPSESYNQEEQGLPFYQGVTDFGTMHPNPTIWCTESKKTAQKNSILLSVRAPVGEINLTVTECCLGRGVAALYTLDNNLIYCYYLITQNKKRFLPYSQGTTYDAINSSEIANIRLAHTTNIVEQQKIASILSGVDAYIQINQEYKEKLERLKKGLMQNLLTGKIRVKT